MTEDERLTLASAAAEQRLTEATASFRDALLQLDDELSIVSISAEWPAQRTPTVVVAWEHDFDRIPGEASATALNPSVNSGFNRRLEKSWQGITFICYGGLLEGEVKTSESR